MIKSFIGGYYASDKLFCHTKTWPDIKKGSMIGQEWLGDLHQIKEAVSYCYQKDKCAGIERPSRYMRNDTPLMLFNKIVNHEINGPSEGIPFPEKGGIRTFQVHNICVHVGFSQGIGMVFFDFCNNIKLIKDMMHAGYNVETCQVLKIICLILDNTKTKYT